MDKNEFFRQATLRICGKLDTEEAMMASLNFLKQEMPVDSMLLQLFVPDLKVVRTVAIATHEKAMTPDTLTPMTPDALQEIGRFEKDYRQQSTSFAWLLRDDLNQRKMFFEMFQIHDISITSLLVLPLMLGDKIVGGGAILLATEGEKKFTQHHANMLSLLKEPFAIAMSNVLKHKELVKYKNLLADENQNLRRELRQLSGEEIIGKDFGLKEVMKNVRHVAAMNSPVLLLGETGVGKDVIANAIHYSSSRKNEPFLKVNCGAIPDNLIDSELFGHEKGAFTGALSLKRGRFERADKGTIFLDEIGELPLQAQVRLLHVLQDKEIERVGGNKSIQLDIRIIAATNRNLEQMVENNRFREDLWFRLNVFPIRVPPVRERKLDVPALVQHFLIKKSKELKLTAIPTLNPDVIDSLINYRWPGNVRELENLIERALILNPAGPLSTQNFNLDHTQNISDGKAQKRTGNSLDEVISRHIIQILEKTNYKVAGEDGAAAILGVNPNTLRNRMKKLGINYSRR